LPKQCSACESQFVAVEAQLFGTTRPAAASFEARDVQRDRFRLGGEPFAADAGGKGAEVAPVDGAWPASAEARASARSSCHSKVASA
jgi:hypothetical protein